MERIVEEIKTKIDKANKIALFTHVNCDCDGIGSMLGLYNFLTENYKDVDMFVDSEIPDRLKFLKNIEKINIKENERKDAFIKEENLFMATIDFDKYDLLVSLDTSNLERLGKFASAYKNHKNTINIDHHKYNTYYGIVDCVREYSSNGEVLFEMMKEMGVDFSQTTATCIFSSISSDTNRFSNSNITSKTHLFASELIDLGADHNLVNTCLFKNKTREQLNLISFMAKNLKFYKGVSYFYMRPKDIKKLGVKSSDVSTYMYIIGNVSDSKITLAIKERGDKTYRIGLRSTDNYDVGKVASMFGGGGHVNASGCEIKGNFKKEFKKVLQECVREIVSKDAKLDKN